MEAFRPWLIQFQQNPQDSIRDFYEWLLYLQGDELKQLVNEVIKKAQHLDRQPYRTICLLYELYGIDCGVLIFPLRRNCPLVIQNRLN